jgi:tRNA(adenine34) deaminase
MTHEEGMRLALAEARLAAQADEVPVGAVVVCDGAVLARAHNRCVALRDGTAHAELLAMQAAARQRGGRLTGCTLYVTLEPCAMCAGAAVNLRLEELVFGAFDPRAGCCGSLVDLTDRCLLHSVRTWGGILEDDCAALLSDFFRAKRCNLP